MRIYRPRKCVSPMILAEVYPPRFVGIDRSWDEIYGGATQPLGIRTDAIRRGPYSQLIWILGNEQPYPARRRASPEELRVAGRSVDPGSQK